MPTYQNDPVISRNAQEGEPAFGVYGESQAFNAIRGVSYAAYHGAVVGVSENHTPHAGPGVFGQSDGTGVQGVSQTWMGVAGQSNSTTGGAGLYGEGAGGGPGLIAVSKGGPSGGWHGAYGETSSTTGGAGVWGEHKNNGVGVCGKSGGGPGVWGVSDTHEGVHAETHSPGTAAIAAYNLNPNGTGAALFAKKEGNVGHAGFFDGNVFVTKVLQVGQDICCVNADCAEDFDVADPDSAEPGTVMVLRTEGKLQPSDQPYDRRVAGVISGAGGYKPGIVLDRREATPTRKPVALLGKVFCKVDASYSPIDVGDLLTTSRTPGHAMKAGDPLLAFGAVIGKALEALGEGQGLIPILIALN
jgi:hypothetical protein